MDTSKIKFGGYAAVAVLVAGGIGYWWAQSTYQPRIVEVSKTACGVPTATARFGVPLQTAMTSMGNLPFGVGPVELPQGGGLVNLTFDPATDGKGREVKMVGNNLYLPTAFGRNDQLPERITISCRDGAVGTVRYQGGNRTSSTFNVVREAATAAAVAAPADPDQADGAPAGPAAAN
ncbi:MAG TPA: hypothetical protein VFG47_06055 [Geminicoccaceae bacterium]|nr:hypothetical protein [Geminicoccaceae bacterium]